MAKRDDIHSDSIIDNSMRQSDASEPVQVFFKVKWQYYQYEV